jgi:hypothetical protein
LQSFPVSIVYLEISDKSIEETFFQKKAINRKLEKTATMLAIYLNCTIKSLFNNGTVVR